MTRAPHHEPVGIHVPAYRDDSWDEDALEPTQKIREDSDYLPTPWYLVASMIVSAICIVGLFVLKAMTT